MAGTIFDKVKPRSGLRVKKNRKNREKNYGKKSEKSSEKIQENAYF
jgi:hypothetical protein